MRRARERGLAVLVGWLVVAGCHDRYKEMQQQAAASASAAAAASASALAAVLASASAQSHPAAAKKPPEWIRAQHILVAYGGAQKSPKKVTRTKEEARLRAEEARAKAASGAFEFADLARIYSDDPSGQDREGMLGRIEPKDVVKEFADVAFALEVDELSKVVETPFGFHVIKRTQ